MMITICDTLLERGTKRSSTDLHKTVQVTVTDHIIPHMPDDYGKYKSSDPQTALVE